MSTKEVSQMVTEQLKTYLNDPVVLVRFINFRISVFGEVTRPGNAVLPNRKGKSPWPLDLRTFSAALHIGNRAWGIFLDHSCGPTNPTGRGVTDSEERREESFTLALLSSEEKETASNHRRCPAPVCTGVFRSLALWG